jgi:hypothetical protein
MDKKQFKRIDYQSFQEYLEAFRKAVESGLYVSGTADPIKHEYYIEVEDDK